MPQFDVFLSHSSVDKAWCAKLKDDLRRYGVSVWLDRDEIRPGDLFGEALEHALDDCGAVALVVSPEAVNSNWVKAEYYRALALSKDRGAHLQLIPVILRDAEFPRFLQDHHWVDFRDETVYDHKVWELVWGITGQKPDQVIRLDTPDPTLEATVSLGPSRNPFIVGAPVAPGRFIGRHREIRNILDRLANPADRGGSAISGVRRIGKTSLLHYIWSSQVRATWPDLASPQVRFLYLDGHTIDQPLADQFWKSVLLNLRDCLEGDLQSRAQSLIADTANTHSLIDFFTQAGEKGYLVVTLLDEFDPVMDYVDPDEPRFFYTLRSLLNLPSPRGFSLVVASRESLDTLFQDVKWRGSEFYNNMPRIRLRPFEADEVDELLDSYLEGSGISFGSEVRRFLLQASEGYPQAVQHGASMIFDDIVLARARDHSWRLGTKQRAEISAELAQDKPRPE